MRLEGSISHPDVRAALAHSSDLYAKDGKSDHPANLVFTAMTHFKLGHAADARAAIAQLRALMPDPASADTWAKDDKANAFLKEAEELIEGPPATQPGAAVPQTQPASVPASQPSSIT